MTTVQNTLPGGIGLPGGPVIAGGGSADVEGWDKMKSHPVIAAHLKSGALVAGGSSSTAKDDEASDQKANSTSDSTTYEAREKSAGWWGIYDTSGNEVGKSLREDDAKAFNALSDQEKQAYVAERRG